MLIMSCHVYRYLSADPDPVTGDLESAMAVQLNPWVEYEFRVVATNAIGTGDPSIPSRGVRTKEAGKVLNLQSFAWYHHAVESVGAIRYTDVVNIFCSNWAKTWK